MPTTQTYEMFLDSYPQRVDEQERRRHLPGALRLNGQYPQQRIAQEYYGDSRQHSEQGNELYEPLAHGVGLIRLAGADRLACHYRAGVANADEEDEGYLSIELNIVYAA